jgi:hypothetical protein
VGAGVPGVQAERISAASRKRAGGRCGGWMVI